MSSSNNGDLVLDPFVGSGTTGVIAKRFNRRFIGIDIEKDFCELTIKRVNEQILLKQNIKTSRA